MRKHLDKARLRSQKRPVWLDCACSPIAQNSPHTISLVAGVIVRLARQATANSTATLDYISHASMIRAEQNSPLFSGTYSGVSSEQRWGSLYAA